MRGLDMLRPKQFAICALLAASFWASATLCIKFYPVAVNAGMHGNITFLTSVPVSWFSIWLTCRLARLEPHQILAGCLVVLGGAMMIDGAALRWFPHVYAGNDTVTRYGAAWLLWGYGLGAWIALAMASRSIRAKQSTPVA
ncbi:hypothetical protein BAR24_14205 [Gluconobacter oxydans]|nr:hypothetical protein BAR24_14205 [Gluconobacter oxydans]